MPDRFSDAQLGVYWRSPPSINYVIVTLQQCGDCGFKSQDDNLFDYHRCVGGKTYAEWVDLYEQGKILEDQPTTDRELQGSQG